MDLCESNAPGGLWVVKRNTWIRSPERARHRRVLGRWLVRFVNRTPGLLPVEDAAFDGEGLKLVSRFLPAGDLQQWLELGPLSPGTARRLLLEAAAPVAHLAVNGFGHGDLRAENILLDHNRRVRVCDYEAGVLQTMGALPMESPAPLSIAGRLTPPEGCQTAAQADVLSLPALLIQSLIGGWPKAWTDWSSFEDSAQSIFDHAAPGLWACMSQVAEDAESATGLNWLDRLARFSNDESAQLQALALRELCESDVLENGRVGTLLDPGDGSVDVASDLAAVNPTARSLDSAALGPSFESSGQTQRLGWWRIVGAISAAAIAVPLVLASVLHPAPETFREEAAVRAFLQGYGYDPHAAALADLQAFDVAVRAFQWNAGIDVDGLVGPQTREAMSQRTSYTRYWLRQIVPAQHRPSFDCSEVDGSAIQSMICAVPKLALMDTEKSRLSREAQDSGGDSASVLGEDQDWFAQLGDHCEGMAPARAKIACIAEQYRERIDELLQVTHAGG